MKIEQIQRHLEKVYRLIPTPSVQAYLITEEELRRSTPERKAPASQVLLREDQDEVRLGIHLEKEVLSRLESSSSKLHLPSLLSATEEISHFLFLVWSLLNCRPVSLLDIEVQGEIDKFLLASEWIPDEKTLLNVLFEHVDYDPRLSPSSRARYEEANRLGRKFCRSFLTSEPSHSKAKLLKWLRTFYRMTSPTRLAHLSVL